MEIWNEIKKQIKFETKWYFEPKGIDTDPLVETLKKVFNAPIDSQYSLGGLATTYTNALFKVIDEDSSKKDRISNFEVLKNVEPFLKKILYFKDFEKFLEIKDEQKGLTPILKSCGLNNDNIYMDEEHLNRFSKEQYEYHLIKTYLLRNLESHNCELWSWDDLNQNITTELIFYMEAVKRCHDAVAEKLSEVKTDYTTYIINEITEFEKWASRFVATDTVEDFSVFESYAVEHITFCDENEENEEDEKIVKERSGTVDWIRKNSLPERRMILWGDAGLGKSTTLQYLTYLDAKAYREGITNIIPVYIPLGMLIDRNETLEMYIFNKLKAGVDEGKILLESGKINLFLDGVNEIPEDKSSDILSKRIKEIQLLIDNYPKTLIIISNRPEKYNQFKNIPVFRLQPMDYAKIMEFINKNTGSEEVRKLIKEKIETNQRLLNIIRTPLMTTRLISIVQEFKKVPESEGMIIKQFLDALYKRERVDKQDAKFDDDKINYLLTSLAVYGFKKNGTNSGLTRYEVLKCFSNCLEDFHFEYDTIYALDILIKMGVFNCDTSGEVIVFSHQAYQDYYLSRAETISLLSESEVKKNDEKISEVCEEDFFDIIANDTKFEKYITYEIQLLSNQKKMQKITKLCEYNIVLAAKISVSSDKNEKIDEYIIDKTKDLLDKNFSNDEIIITCMHVYIEMKYPINLLQCIENIFKLQALRRKVLIGKLASSMNESQYVYLLEIVCSSNLHKDNKKAFLDVFIHKNSLKNKVFSWNGYNDKSVLKITETISVLNISQEKRIILYTYLNIPKNLIVEDLNNLINNVKATIPITNNGLQIAFLNKYDSSFNSYEFLKIYLDRNIDYSQVLTLGVHLNWYKFLTNHLRNIQENFDSAEKENIFIELYEKYLEIKVFFHISLPIKTEFNISKNTKTFIYTSYNPKEMKFNILKEYKSSCLLKEIMNKQFSVLHNAFVGVKVNIISTESYNSFYDLAIDEFLKLPHKKNNTFRISNESLEKEIDSIRKKYSQENDVYSFLFSKLNTIHKANGAICLTLYKDEIYDYELLCTPNYKSFKILIANNIKKRQLKIQKNKISVFIPLFYRKKLASIKNKHQIKINTNKLVNCSEDFFSPSKNCLVVNINWRNKVICKVKCIPYYFDDKKFEWIVNKIEE